MIPNKSGVSARSLVALAVTCCASLIPSMGAGAQESSGGVSEAAVEATTTPVAASAAAPPRITLSHTFTGSVHETFRLDIDFSQSVTGFIFSEIQVTHGATPVPPLNGSGRSYWVDMTTDADYEGFVAISIPSGAAQNGAGENNIGEGHTFRVDNKPPDLDLGFDRRPRVDRDELILTYTEHLDERFIPSVNDYAVSYIRNGRFLRSDVTQVEVVAHRVFLILDDDIRFGDRVELYYDDRSINAIRDLAGNFAPGMLQQDVRNDTRELVGEAPGPPRNLTADADGTSVIELNWDAPADTGSSAVIGYRIEASSDGGTNWRSIETDTRSTATTYRHTRLEPNTTRHYRVSAINGDREGNPSNVASATTGGFLPDPPRRLSATARGGSAIELDWTAPLFSGSAGPITGYRIEVSARRTGGWTVLVADTRSSRVTEYTDTGLSPGTTRYYRVAAINSEGRGDWSSVASATTDADAPDAPTGLTAVPSGLGGRNELLLRWTRPSSDGGSPVTGYRIEVSLSGTSGWTALVANTRSTATEYTHRGLSPSTTRYYRVAAINAEGTGDFSTVASGTTNAGTPTAPLGIRARADGATSIALSWNAPLNDNGSPITGYRIQVRRSGSSAWVTLTDNTFSTATTYQHTNLQPVTVYGYRVAAINAVGAGAWSPEASTRTHAAPPDAPPTVSARAVSTSRIDLSWSVPRNTGGAPILGYRIEASRDGGTRWQIIVANTESTGRTYSHRNLLPGATWSYRISAINNAGVGAPSGVARATTHAVPPGAPRSLRATPGGFGGRDQIVLTWSAPSSDGGSPITGYRVDVSTRRSGPWTVLVRSTGTTGTTYTHTGLGPGTTRYYRVAAVNARGTGTFSAVATGMTNAGPPDAPQNLRAAADGPTAITIAWEAPGDNGAAISGYRIRMRRISESSWTTIRNNTGSTATIFQHTNLQPVTTYRYQVAAINSEGAGPWSADAGATTPAGVPAPPTGLVARAMGTSQIDLSWRAPANTGGAPILGYRVEASSDGGANWRILARHTRSTGTTYSHRNLQPASTHHYRVSAINQAGLGRASTVARATTEAAVPDAPRNLRAVADGTSEIDLSWRAPSTDGGARITGYRIEVSDDGSATWQTLVANTLSTGTDYSHTGLSPASTRHYRVSAINRVGAGGASNVASATTDATVPDAPTGLTAIATAPTRIDLTWAAPAYDGGAAVTGYRIEASETGAAWTDLVRNTASTSTAYSHRGLQPGTRRFYRVSAINRAGTGEPSAVASAATDDPVGRAGRLNTRVLPHVAAAMTSSTVGAIADRIDAVASGMGMRRRMDMGGLSSMAASFSSPAAGGSPFGRRDPSGAALLFGGSSFQMPLGSTGSPQQASGPNQMATWGAGEYHHLGEPGESVLDWSGNMISVHVGADVRIAPYILAGVAASHNTGTFDFTDKTGASPVTGTYGTTMSSVNPYVAWFSGERGNAAWATGGFGWGDVEVKDEREALRNSPARMLTGAAGGSYQVLETGIGGVRVKAEGWAGRVLVDGGERIDSVTLDMQRARLALEWTQGFRSADGNEVAIALEGGMRYDNGDGINGTSGEVGGGLRYSNVRVGLTAEGRGRLLISAREGYEEWGFGGMIQFDPATRGQGLSIRVAPSYGDAASGVNRLWDQGVSSAVQDRNLTMGPNLDTEVAYGLAGFRGTPYSGFRLAENGARAFSSGLRYGLGSGLGVRIEGTRREGAFGAAQHAVGVRGRLRFR